MTAPKLGYRVGERVRILEAVRVFGGRRGTVAALNNPAGEVGVVFSTERAPGSRGDTDAWFRPGEIERVPESAHRAPRGRA